MTGEAATDFRGWTCHAPEARIARFTNIVMQSVARESVRRVLDVGCGAGLQLRRLAEEFPAAELVGVDISPTNIAAAESSQRNDPASARMTFIEADYFSMPPSTPFELVVSDGVLHLVSVDDHRVAATLASALAADGTLIISMASDCLYNRAFAVARRALRAMRSRATDAVILGAARLFHRDMNDQMLRERVPYMYTPPARLMGEPFLEVLARHGLHLLATHRMESTSPSQLTHAAYVFRKTVPGTRAS